METVCRVVVELMLYFLAPSTEGLDAPLSRSFVSVACSEGTASVHVLEHPSDSPTKNPSDNKTKHKDGVSLVCTSVPPRATDRNMIKDQDCPASYVPKKIAPL